MATTGFTAAAGYPKFATAAFDVGIRLFGQDAGHGAWPGLYAATMPDVQGGQYLGPNGLGEIRGAPTLAAIASRARDEVVAERLWSESEALTGVTYGVLDKPRAA